MDSSFLAPWVQISLGGLGLAWALSVFAELRDRPARPTERLNAWGLGFFSVAMVALGAVRWLDL